MHRLKNLLGKDLLTRFLVDFIYKLLDSVDHVAITNLFVRSVYTSSCWFSVGSPIFEINKNWFGLLLLCTAVVIGAGMLLWSWHEESLIKTQSVVFQAYSHRLLECWYYQYFVTLLYNIFSQFITGLCLWFPTKF